MGSNKADGDNLKDKWVSYLFSKPLTDAEMFLLQKSLPFAVSLYHITATKHTSASLCENSLFGETECTEYYPNVMNILFTFVAKPTPIA